MPDTGRLGNRDAKPERIKLGVGTSSTGSSPVAGIDTPTMLALAVRTRTLTLAPRSSTSITTRKTTLTLNG